MTMRLVATCLVIAGCQSGSGQPAPEPAAGARAPLSAAAELDRELQSAPGRIVFLDNAGGQPSLAAVPPSGGEPRAMPAAGDYAVFPADGSLELGVATWGGEEDHREQLAIADGEGRWRRLGPVASKIRNPVTPAGGTWVAFESDAESFRDIYRVDVATGALARLTEDGDGAFDPTASPDGRAIAFVTTVGGDAEIHVMAADGSGRRLLIDMPGQEQVPRWSPTGDAIVFMADRDGAERLFLARADGSQPERVTALDDGERHEADPVWSPDGRRIAYLVHHATGPRELWVVDLDTRATHRASPPLAHVEHMSWSPDSRFLAYSDDTDAGRTLFVARADGSARRPLVAAGTDRWLPRWRSR